MRGTGQPNDALAVASPGSGMGTPRAARSLLSFGHGYCARALGRELVARGWRVTGTTRSEDKVARIRETGAEAAIFPGARPGEVPSLDGVTHLLVSAGPDSGGDPVLRRLRREIAQRAGQGQFEWVGYLSTTGVYGDQDGGWVDETTPPEPTTERGKWRLRAEQDWAGIEGLPLHVFRLAGIQGPGRGALEKVRRGVARRIAKPGQVFSRIHVDDVVQVLLASIARPNPGAAYNVCDDEPAPPQDVIECAARALGLPVPPEEPFESAGMSPLARSFYADNKRVRNDRIKRELGVALRFPTYREALEHEARRL